MQSKKPVLLILAAGMGSRYGGLKQLDRFGPAGETIIDFSLADALEAGFENIIFVIRESFEVEFKERMLSRWKGKLNMEFVFQELHTLPDGFICPSDRIKPWGTGHAVWVAHNLIDSPFGVINADDYYGKEAMIALYKFLKKSEANPIHYGLIAYHLKNTLSDFGAVNRGVCESDRLGFLKKITECKGIQHNTDSIYFEKDDCKCILDKETLVSMNMWAFQPSYFQWSEEYFTQFLTEKGLKGQEEFYIPELIQMLIDHDEIKVSIIQSNSQWFGVTYQEDKPMVEKAFQEKLNNGEYPIFIE